MREQRLAATWARELEAVAARIGAFVPRPESRYRLARFMRVTVAGDTRRIGWQLAEAAADVTCVAAARRIDMNSTELRGHPPSPALVLLAEESHASEA